MHTTSHVNSVSRNLSLALITQKQKIDQELTDRVIALEEIFLYIGVQIQNIMTCLTTLCYASYKRICVTPLYLMAQRCLQIKYRHTLEVFAIVPRLLSVWILFNVILVPQLF